ncbi:hypothetical protein EJ07DRAFT_159016 [Lizonia empirigonia]|nr:hypothetical protein EJ07DRAFT_159016 [Lizonia empirigonia]
MYVKYSKHPNYLVKTTAKKFLCAAYYPTRILEGLSLRALLRASSCYLATLSCTRKRASGSSRSLIPSASAPKYTKYCRTTPPATIQALQSKATISQPSSRIHRRPPNQLPSSQWRPETPLQPPAPSPRPPTKRNRTLTTPDTNSPPRQPPNRRIPHHTRLSRPRPREAPSSLYTIQGATNPYPVQRCAHTTLAQVIVPEALILEMQHKIEELGIRGLRLVREKMSAMQAGKVWLVDLRALERQAWRAEKRDAQGRKELGMAMEKVADAQARCDGVERKITVLALVVRYLRKQNGCLEKMRSAQKDEVSEALEMKRANARLVSERDEARQRLLVVENEQRAAVGALKVMRGEVVAAGNEGARADAHLHTSQLADTALREENTRLANADADCATLAEQLSELEFENAHLRAERDAAAQRVRDMEAYDAYLDAAEGEEDPTTSRIRELEARNAYLETRMRFYEMDREASVEDANASRLSWATRSVRSLRLRGSFWIDEESQIGRR